MVMQQTNPSGHVMVRTKPNPRNRKHRSIHWISLRMSQNQLDNNKDSQKPSRNQLGSSYDCQTVCSKEQHEQIWAIYGTHNQHRLLVCTTWDMQNTCSQYEVDVISMQKSHQFLKIYSNTFCVGDKPKRYNTDKEIIIYCNWITIKWWHCLN